MSKTKVNEDIVEQAVKDGKVNLKVFYKILSPHQLQCVQLKFIEGYSYCQIASIIGSKQSAVRLNVMYGMNKIIKYLDEEESKGKSLFCSKHPTGAAVDIDADINEDSLDTIEVELSEDNLEEMLESIRKGTIK